MTLIFAACYTCSLCLVGFVGELNCLYTGHERIQDGTIALNVVQRRDARVSIDDMITVRRFVPPENFDLTLLALDLSLCEIYVFGS
ncbi:unnamed protein product [Arabis nemorensis]|uniref:Uncharacterized protein n=1 Tax=Arabis nemorensis TaxID=586526 RepID=A0A565CKJ8_9BRAS|nr:unnamed protein product [Arabis nemorensis]